MVIFRNSPENLISHYLPQNSRFAGTDSAYLQIQSQWPDVYTLLLLSTVYVRDTGLFIISSDCGLFL